MTQDTGLETAHASHSGGELQKTAEQELQEKKTRFRQLASQGVVNSQTITLGWKLFGDIEKLEGGALDPHISEAVGQLTNGRGDKTASSLARFALRTSTYEGFRPGGIGELLEGVATTGLDKAKDFCKAMDSARFFEGAMILEVKGSATNLQKQLSK